MHLLPEVRQSIQKASKQQDSTKSKKKLDKATKALKGIIEESRKQIFHAQAALLEGTAIRKPKKFNNFLELVKQERPGSLLAKSAKDIDDAIAFCFESKGISAEEEPEGDSQEPDYEEISKLNINVDDLNIGLEEYKKVLNKVFAGLRYEMYQKVKQYWQDNGDQILEEKGQQNPSQKP